MNETSSLYPEITVGFFCSGTYYVGEGAGSVSVTVELQRGCPARDVIVTLRTVDGSARGRNGKQGGIKH